MMINFQYFLVGIGETKLNNNMNVFSTCFLLLCLTFIEGCGSNNLQKDGLTQSYEDNIKFFEQIKESNIHMLRNIEAEWRYSDMLLIRYVNPEFVEDVGYSFLVKRNAENKVCIRTEDKWELGDNIFDSINCTFDGLTKDKISYCFSLMEKYNLKKINNLSDQNMISIQKGSLHVYYFFDQSISKPKILRGRLESIGDNWWVLK